MLTATFTTTPAFDSGLAALIRDCGINAQKVVAKETGELIKTLVRISPPKNPSKTRESIRQNISSKFAMAGDEANSGRHADKTKAAPSGMRWYSMDSDYLYGVAPQLDKRQASVDDLESILYRITSRGKLVMDFKHPRRKQKVLLWQTVLARKGTINKLIAKKVKAVGRLKAGWLVAVDRGAITISGAIPEWVKRHASGARGRFINGLASPTNPRFEIANSAKGVGAPFIRYAINAACKIRAKAMQSNALLFMRGKKNISDYK